MRGRPGVFSLEVDSGDGRSLRAAGPGVVERRALPTAAVATLDEAGPFFSPTRAGAGGFARRRRS